MPLDATGLSLDPLVKMGITPVPEDFVTRYKVDYRDDYFRRHPERLPRSNDIKWMTIYYDRRSILTSDILMSVNRSGFCSPSLRNWLATPTSGLGNTNDYSVAPPEIINLAELVQGEVQGATFELDYFETDPVLSVVYEFDGKKHKACLGIWDCTVSPRDGRIQYPITSGKIVAIANH